MQNFYNTEVPPYFCLGLPLGALVPDGEDNVLLPNNLVMYGPWNLSDFEDENFSEKIKNFLGADSLPVGLTIGVFSETDENGDPVPSSLKEYWWLGSNLGFVTKNSGSNGGNGSSDSESSSIYMSMNRLEISIPMNIDGKCTSQILKNNSITLVRIKKGTTAVKLIDGEASNFTFALQGLTDTGLTYHYQVINTTEDSYLEFWYEFENSSTDAGTYDDTIIGTFSDNLQISVIFVLTDTFNDIKILTITKNDKGYNYLLNMSPSYIHIDQSYILSNFTLDIDKYGYADLNSYTLTELSEIQNNLKIYYYHDNDIYKLTPIIFESGLVELTSDCTITKLNSDLTEIEDSTVTITNFLKSDTTQFRDSDRVKCVYTDSAGVGTVAWPNIINDSYLSGAISKRTSFNLTHSDVILASKFKGVVNNTVVQDITTNSVQYKSDGELVGEATITNINVTSANYTLVLVDKDGNKYETSNTETDSDLFENDIRSFYFKMIDSDSGIDVSASYKDGDAVKTDTLTFVISFNEASSGYHLNVLPNIIGCQDGSPSEPTLMFEIIKYGDDEKTLTFDEFVSDNLHITVNNNEVTLTDLSYTVPTDLPDLYDFSKALTVNIRLYQNTILWSTDTVSYYQLPKDATMIAKLNIDNNYAIVDIAANNNTLEYATKTGITYFDGTSEKELAFFDTYVGNSYSSTTLFLVTALNSENESESDVSEIITYYLECVPAAEGGTATFKLKILDNGIVAIIKEKESTELSGISYVKFKYNLYSDLAKTNLLASGILTLKMSNTKDGSSYKLVCSPTTLYKTTTNKLTDDASSLFTFSIAKIEDGAATSVPLQTKSNAYIALNVGGTKYYSYLKAVLGSSYWSITNIYDDYIGDNLDADVTVEAYIGETLIDSLTLNWCVVSASPFSIQLTNDNVIATVNSTATDLRLLSTTGISVYNGDDLYTFTGLKIVTATIPTTSPLYGILSISSSDDGDDSYWLTVNNGKALIEGTGFVDFTVSERIDGVSKVLGHKRLTFNIISNEGTSYKLVVTPNNIYQSNTGTVSPNSITCKILSIHDGAVTNVTGNGNYYLSYEYAGNSSVLKLVVKPALNALSYVISGISSSKLKNSTGINIQACSASITNLGYTLTIGNDTYDVTSTDAGSTIYITSYNSTAVEYNGSKYWARLVHTTSGNSSNNDFYVVLFADSANASLFGQTGTEFYLDTTNYKLYSDINGDTDITTLAKAQTVIYGTFVNGDFLFDPNYLSSYLADAGIHDQIDATTYPVLSSSLTTLQKSYKIGEVFDSETVGVSRQGNDATGAGYLIALLNDSVTLDDNASNTVMELTATFGVNVLLNGSSLQYSNSEYYIKTYVYFMGVDENSLETVYNSGDDDVTGNEVFTVVESTTKGTDYSATLLKVDADATLPEGDGYVRIVVYSDNTYTTLVGEKRLPIKVLNYNTDGGGYALTITPNSIYRTAAKALSDTTFKVQLTKFTGDGDASKLSFAPDDATKFDEEEMHVAFLDKDGVYHNLSCDVTADPMGENVMKIADSKLYILSSLSGDTFDLSDYDSISFVAYKKVNNTNIYFDSETVDFSTQGDTGTTGGIIRIRGVWKLDEAYCYLSDTNDDYTDYDTTSDYKYIDVVEYTAGGQTNYYEAIAGDAATKNINQVPLTSTKYWKKADHYGLMITDHMYGKIVETDELLIKSVVNDHEITYGGMIGSNSTLYDPSDDNNVILWAGNDGVEDRDQSDFSLTENGNLTCCDVYIPGTDSSKKYVKMDTTDGVVVYQKNDIVTPGDPNYITLDVMDITADDTYGNDSIFGNLSYTTDEINVPVVRIHYLGIDYILDPHMFIKISNSSAGGNQMTVLEYKFELTSLSKITYTNNGPSTTIYASNGYSQTYSTYNVYDANNKSIYGTDSSITSITALRFTPAYISFINKSYYYNMDSDGNAIFSVNVYLPKQYILGTYKDTEKIGPDYTTAYWLAWADDRAVGNPEDFTAAYLSAQLNIKPATEHATSFVYCSKPQAGGVFTFYTENPVGKSADTARKATVKEYSMRIFDQYGNAVTTLYYHQQTSGSTLLNNYWTSTSLMNFYRLAAAAEDLDTLQDAYGY